MLLKNLCVEKKLKQLVLVWLQAGHSFPINLSLSLGGSLLSYIYSAPPLKVCSDIESVTQSHCWSKSVIYFFWLILQLSVVGAWFDGLVDHPMSSSELKVSWLLARMWWNFKSVVMVCAAEAKWLDWQLCSWVQLYLSALVTQVFTHVLNILILQSCFSWSDS